MPSSIFGRHRRTASQKGLQSPFAQAARPSPSCLRSLSHTALAGRRSRRPPALCRRVFGRLRKPPSPVAVRTVDTSEFFQVSNKVVRGVLEFIRGHALLFDQILREDLSGADELTMEKVNLVVSILTKVSVKVES
nr:nuclear pore complex protein NUP205 [Ipomoea batatas]